MRVWDIFPAFYLYSVGVITLSGTESYFLNVATRFVLLFFNKTYQLRVRFFCHHHIHKQTFNDKNITCFTADAFLNPGVPNIFRCHLTGEILHEIKSLITPQCFFININNKLINLNISSRQYT